MKKAIYVMGSGRSGTAILGKMIAKHPGVFNFVETRFLVDSGGLSRVVNSKNPMKVLKRRMLRSLSETRKNCPQLKPIYKKAKILKLFETENNINDVIYKFFDMGLEYVGKNIMLDKTPHCVIIADILYNIFPNSKFIHIFRNPYDVYASVKPLFWGPLNVKAFITWYNKVMIGANSARKKIPKDRYLIIKMEDLVMKPWPNIEKISKFIGEKLGEESVKVINKTNAHMRRYEHELEDIEIEAIRKNCMISYNKWMKLYKKQSN